MEASQSLESESELTDADTCNESLKSWETIGESDPEDSEILTSDRHSVQVADEQQQSAQDNRLSNTTNHRSDSECQPEEMGFHEVTAQEIDESASNPEPPVPETLATNTSTHTECSDSTSAVAVTPDATEEPEPAPICPPDNNEWRVTKTKEVTPDVTEEPEPAPICPPDNEWRVTKTKTSFFAQLQPSTARTPTMSLRLKSYLSDGSRLDILASPDWVEELRSVRNMPTGMVEVHLEEDLCVPGYEGNGCIVIQYTLIDCAVGRNVPDMPVTAFLPNVPQAHRIARLLCAAFEQRWTFIATDGPTKGSQPVVHWGPLTHKIELFGDANYPAFFAYPDPTYLDRLAAELEVLDVKIDS